MLDKEAVDAAIAVCWFEAEHAQLLAIENPFFNRPVVSDGETYTFHIHHEEEPCT